MLVEERVARSSREGVALLLLVVVLALRGGVSAVGSRTGASEEDEGSKGGMRSGASMREGDSEGGEMGEVCSDDEVSVMSGGGW